MSDIGSVRGPAGGGMIDDGLTIGTTTRPVGSTVSTAPPPTSPPPGAGDGAPSIGSPRMEIADLNARMGALADKLGTGAPGVADLGVIMQKIEEIQHAMDSEQVKAQGKEIEANKLTIKNNVADQLKKIDDAQAKLAAQKKWGLFGKIFGGIAIGLACIAAIATGGALAIGVALVSAALFALQESGGMNKMFDAMHMSDKAKMWTMIGISAVMLIAGGVAAYSAISSTVTTAATAMMKLGAAAQTLGGVAKVGAGAAQVGSSIAGFEVSEMNDDRTRLQTQNLRMKQQQEELIADLKKLLDQLESGVKTTTEVVQQQSDSVQYEMRAMKS